MHKREELSPPTASIAAFSLSIIDSARIVFVLHLFVSAPALRPVSRARARAMPRCGRRLCPGRRARWHCSATVGGSANAWAVASATTACNRHNISCGGGGGGGVVYQ